MAKQDPDLSRVFQALADPTRRGMLARLALRDETAGALALPTGLALPTVMRHLAVLESAGLIATEKAGRSRLCRARPDALAASEGWLAGQRALWEARTDRLENFVATMMAKERP